jgi:septum formation protein
MKDTLILLASGSPRRRELLKMVGLEFEVMVSNQEESYKSKKPKEIVVELAFKKGLWVADEVYNTSLKKSDESLSQEMIIISADTIVVLEGEVLEKPGDDKEAYEMIKKLQGNEHQVYTGVALFKGSGVLREEDLKNPKLERCPLSERFQVVDFVVETKVVVNEMTEDEIWNYVRSGESLDKAGGYGIQGGFAKFIEKIEGDFYNVMGLPVARLYQEIKKLL